MRIDSRKLKKVIEELLSDINNSSNFMCGIGEPIGQIDGNIITIYVERKISDESVKTLCVTFED